MDKNDKKYSVIYYDTDNVTEEQLADLSDQITAFHKKKGVNFLLLPTTLKQKWTNKEELLKLLNEMIEEVKSWE
jgi:hypothetical protein